ncbi:hypothetical protein [Streptomyces sp. DSM 15324]|uniref:hypothetical protein n=1 Tax=Streptomyces sp. DSM 15324 TaxID=1739111 RepID=UPI00131E5B6A|nr:hypothetical protein [Streptomyces sp. DSM 15324]
MAVPRPAMLDAALRAAVERHARLAAGTVPDAAVARTEPSRGVRAARTVVGEALR